MKDVVGWTTDDWVILGVGLLGVICLCMVIFFVAGRFYNPVCGGV